MRSCGGSMAIGAVAAMLAACGAASVSSEEPVPEAGLDSQGFEGDGATEAEDSGLPPSDAGADAGRGEVDAGPADSSSSTDAGLQRADAAVDAGAGAPDGGRADAGSRWRVTVSPPPMSNPTTLTLPGSYQATLVHGLCEGPGYLVRLDNTKDYVIRTDAVLDGPVHIIGGRNVRVIGMHIDLAPAACADAGYSGYIPGTIALRLEQVGTTFVEGAYIDVRRRSADCMVVRNKIGGGEVLKKDAGYTEAMARGERDVVIQNSVCRGMSGDPDVHGDMIQSQGLYELYRHFVFENVSIDSNCEGTIILDREGFFAAESIVLRRFDYRMDPRYTPNPRDGGGWWTGGPVMNSAKAYSYEEVYLATDVAREYSPNIRPADVVSCDGTDGVRCPSLPPGPDRFACPGNGAASDAWTGLNYVSPHP